MRILVVGAPGAGMGTQGVRIADRYGLTHISSGDLLRRHMTDGTRIGRDVTAYVRRGDLVPDGLIMDMLRKPVVAASNRGGYVLDGFPRTVSQAESAYEIARELGVEVQAVVHLDVPKEELIRRLLARQRGAEDSADVIAHRLEIYDRNTRPMLDYYADRERVVSVDGARPVPEVTAAILAQLGHPAWSPDRA